MLLILVRLFRQQLELVLTTQLVLERQQVIRLLALDLIMNTGQTQRLGKHLLRGVVALVVQQLQVAELQLWRLIRLLWRLRCLVQ